jgi:hypothetical protein
MFRCACACLMLMIASVKAEQAGCPAVEFVSAGSVSESSFFAAPVKRVQEVVADAMQAIGVLLFENTPTLVRGERTSPRVKDMRLPSGNEAIYSYLQPAERNGVQGTLVRVETRRSGSKRGTPERFWSAAVLDEANCLLGLLSVEDPVAGAIASQPAPSAAAGQEVAVPRGTPVSLLLRRFLYSSELRINQRVVFEVALEVKVGQRVVIPCGALAAGRITSAGPKEAGFFTKAERVRVTMIVDFVSASSGEHISVTAPEEFHRRTESRLSKLLWDPNDEASIFRSFGLRAGTTVVVATDRDQTIRVPDAPAR